MDTHDYFSTLGKQGAKVRNKKLTKEQRRKIAVKAAKKRWKKCLTAK